MLFWTTLTVIVWTKTGTALFQVVKCKAFHRRHWKSLIECSLFSVDDIRIATVLLDKT